MNPLSHHSFRELLVKQTQEVSSSEGSFTLQSYNYRYHNYLRSKDYTKWWHLITCTSLSTFILEVARSKGLFSINGIETCLTCHTSEYVVSKKDFNAGTPTCTRCNSIYKGWGGE